LVDPAEIGRRGGLVKQTTRLRKAADDELWEQAREVLSRALKARTSTEQLAAARALFSYRADAPPRGAGDAADRRKEQTAGQVTLTDVL
jgi:hypothetical protein